MAKALRSDKKPIPPIHSTLGLVFSDDEKAEAFADSLELQCRPNIVDADLDHIEQIEHEVEIILSGQHDTPMTSASPEEVRGIIGSLKVKKAPGPDKIPNTALKALPDKVVVALTAIINASLRFCHFPSRWKSANVIFIPKPGKDLLFPQNYRPIGLISNVGKVLEKTILTRLVRATNENHVLPDEQFGFRPKHSTADQLIHVTEFISQGINQKESTGAIFLDVAKAFDTVWHDGLVYKLHTTSVSLAMEKRAGQKDDALLRDDMHFPRRDPTGTSSNCRRGSDIGPLNSTPAPKFDRSRGPVVTVDRAASAFGPRSAPLT
jgi:hypothetical protein